MTSVTVFIALLALQSSVAAPKATNARAAHLVIRSTVCDPDMRPRTESTWRALMRSVGLTPSHSTAVVPHDTWTLQTPIGELRADAFFLADRTSYYLLFFPADTTRAPDAVLTWLLSSGHPAVTEGDRVEVTIPGLPCGKALTTESLELSLSRGTILRSSFGASLHAVDANP